MLPRFCSATEEYALKTGKPCAACHLNPAGGGVDSYGIYQPGSYFVSYNQNSDTG